MSSDSYNPPSPRGTSGAQVLNARNLEFGYAKKVTLQISDLRFHDSEVVGILGPNGAGKSTLLRLLAGLLKPRSGDVTLEGVGSIRTVPASERARRIAWLPQRMEGSFPWTVREMVAAGRHPYTRGWWPERIADSRAIDAAITRLELGALRDRAVEGLSGGEWQRAAIARALVQEASILLLDEPVANLDLKYQREIYDRLHALTRTARCTVVVADHHLDLLAHYCDRLVLLEQGRIVAAGSSDEVLREEILSEVFGTPVDVTPDPRTGKRRVAWRLGAPTGSEREEAHR